MIKRLFAICLVLFLAVPVDAREITAPEVMESGRQLMPQNTDSFGEGLAEILHGCMKLLGPELKAAMQNCGVVVFSAMLFSVLPLLGKKTGMMTSVAGAAAIAVVMLRQSNAMVILAAETIQDILEYGKLLCQVMTAALAAQGGVTESSALYIGTTIFVTLLNSLISGLMIPMFFFYLAFVVAHGAFGDEFLKKTADFIKGIWLWLLKLLIIVFSTYMSVTGVVSGTTDQTALKAAKIVITSAVPVIGGILSDSSEAVLVSMGVLKNAAGVYGMLAVLSVFMGPFIKIMMNYLGIKVSALLCSIFGEKRISSLTEGFATAMSLLLAMTATACMFVLISTVCFLKGAG